MAESEFTLSSAIQFLVDEKSVQKVNQTVNTIKGMIGKALGAIGIGFSLKSMNDAVEQFRHVNLSLESSLGNLEEMDEVQEKILKSSKDVLGNYEDMAKNVGDLVKNNRTLFDVDKATRFTEIMTKLTKLSGGSNADATGLVSSMANAMKNGKFDSGSLEALFAKAPQAVRVLTEYYGVSERKLRTMAQAGILKAKDIQKAFLDAGESVDKAFTQLEPTISDVLSSARSELKFFIGETDEMFGITKMIAKFLREGIQFLIGGLQKVRSGVIFLSQKLGGMENTMKLLAALATAFVIAMNFGKIINGVKSLIGIFGKLGIKGTLIIGIITLIILLIEDFYHFMKGNKSLLGNVLQKLGIDSEEVRKKVFDTWNKIKDFFKNAWSKVQTWWSKNGGSITKSLVSFLRGTVKFVKSIITPIKKWWDENGEEVVNKIKDAFSNAKDLIIRIGHDLEEFWDAHGEEIINLACGAFEALVDAVDGLVKILGDLWDILKNLFSGDWGALWESLKKLGEDFVETLDNIFDDLYNTDLGKKLFDWGDEIAHNFIDGFKHFFDSDKKNILNIVNLARQLVGKEKLSYEEYWGEPDPDAKKDEPQNKDGMYYNAVLGSRIKNQSTEDIKKWAGDHYEKLIEAGASDYYELTELERLEMEMYRVYPWTRNPDYFEKKRGKYYVIGLDKPLSDNDFDEMYAKNQSIDDFIAGMNYMQETATVSPQTAGNTIDSHDKTTNITQNVEINNEFNGDLAGQKYLSESAEKAYKTSFGAMARYTDFDR